MRKLLILSCLFLVIASCSKRPKADLIVTGKIWTGNSTQPYVEAMAITGDSIVAVGPQLEIMN